MIKDHGKTKTPWLPENINHPQLNNNSLKLEIKQELKPEQNKKNKKRQVMLTLFRMGLFRAAHQLEGTLKKLPLISLKSITHILTMMKLGTATPYLKKIQTTYKSHDTLLDVCWHQHFFIRKQQFLYKEISRNIKKYRYELHFNT